MNYSIFAHGLQLKNENLQNIFPSKPFAGKRALWYNATGAKRAKGIDMQKIVFICHGNICRSPMAEYVFADLVKRAGLEDAFFVTSAAVSYEEIGNDVYSPAKRCLASHGVPCPPHAAHRITRKEIEEADLLLCMDFSNLRRLAAISSSCEGKAKLLGEYGLSGAEIEDPWYTGNFSRVYDQISLCCGELLRSLSAGEKK